MGNNKYRVAVDDSVRVVVDELDLIYITNGDNCVTVSPLVAIRLRAALLAALRTIGHELPQGDNDDEQ